MVSFSLPENIGKIEVSWYMQRVKKETSGVKWVKNLKKKYGNHEGFLVILSLYFESNTSSQTQLERSGISNPFCWYNASDVYLALLSYNGSHLLSLFIGKIFSLSFQ